MKRRLRVAVDMPWDATACMGTGAYSETMVRALATTEVELILIAPPGAPRRIPGVRYASLPACDILREGPRQLALPALLREMKADALFAPASLLPLVKICPMVATVHDLTFMKEPKYYAPGLVDYLCRWLLPGLKVAERIIAISENARKELLGHVPEERVRVIEQPVREIFLHPFGEREIIERLRTLGVERPFFFHVSNLSPHKNVSFALEAFAQARTPHLFVLAGGGYAPNQPPDLHAIAARLGIAERVRYLGKISDEDLKALYQGCSAFLFPSLAEGWGLPVAEARALDVPVLASPHVPAAAERLPLELDLWANAMRGDLPRPTPHPGPSLKEAGAALREVLEEVTHERCPVTSRGETPVLAIRGDWRSPSGYGHAARTLHRAAAELKPEAVWAAKDAIQDPRLWSGPAALWREGAETWLHVLPPDHMDLALSGRHVGAFFWETDRVPEGWRDTFRRLDEIWVPSRFLLDVLRESGVSTPAYLCPLPVDTERFSPGARRLTCVDPPASFDPTWTVFLYVGTWDPRKRPDILIRAFCRAFHGSDKALLILKSYMSGDPVRDSQVLRSWIAESRTGDAHVRGVAGVRSDGEMLELYRCATAFVTASRGEGYCFPAVQAMSCGKPVIATSWSAFGDYVAVPVSYRLEHVPKGVGLPGYSSSQRWAVVDEGDLAAKMRWVHDHRAEAALLGEKARSWVLGNASMSVVGRRIAERVLALRGQGQTRRSIKIAAVNA